MPERFSEIENRSVPSKPTLEERLKEYPELKAKIETMLGIIEDAGGDIEKAAEAERRIIEELRQMGNEVPHGWARGQRTKKNRNTTLSQGCEPQGKKPLYWYTRLGKIEIAEQLFTASRRGPQMRPFSESAEVECRGYSEGLQRAVCALEAGAGNQTKFHGVGDGSVWITGQMEVQFGTQAQYLVDFYHLCDYLAAAGEVIAGNDKPDWMEEKKGWLKRQSLEGGSRSSAAVLGTGQHPQPRCSGSCLLSLHLQPLEFPGLQGCSSHRLAHRFGRD